MRKYIIAFFAMLPFLASAQGNWTVPTKTTATESTTEKKVDKKGNETTEVVVDGVTYKVKTEDMPYLKGAVPEVDGKVVYRVDVPLEGMSATEIYNAVYKKMEALVQEPSQTERSKIALVNEEEHVIVASVEEWLVFANKILVLDRSRFNYIVKAECKDGMLNLEINRLFYDYETNGTVEHYLAEGFITDDVMLTKNGTKLRKMNSKFRKFTVDRMTQVLQSLTDIKK